MKHDPIKNLRPFQPGDPRINRAGRRRGKSLAVRLDSLLDKSIQTKDGKSLRGIDAVCMQLVRLAISGNLRAIEILFERLEGKAVQAVVLPDSPAQNEVSVVEMQARVKSLLQRFSVDEVIDVTPEGEQR